MAQQGTKEMIAEKIHRRLQTQISDNRGNDSTVLGNNQTASESVRSYDIILVFPVFLMITYDCDVECNTIVVVVVLFCVGTHVIVDVLVQSVLSERTKQTLLNSSWNRSADEMEEVHI